MSNLRIHTHGPPRPLLGSGRKGRRESFYFSGAPRQLAVASSGLAHGDSFELSLRQFAVAVVDRIFAWRAVEIDADGIAENGAAIGLTAFPHQHHAARIAASPTERGGDFSRDRTRKRPDVFRVVEHRRPFGFQDLDLRMRFIASAQLLDFGRALFLDARRGRSLVDWRVEHGFT